MSKDHKRTPNTVSLQRSIASFYLLFQFHPGLQASSHNQFSLWCFNTHYISCKNNSICSSREIKQLKLHFLCKYITFFFYLDHDTSFINFTKALGHYRRYFCLEDINLFLEVYTKSSISPASMQLGRQS